MYVPDVYERSKGSHQVLRTIYRFKEYIPELHLFIEKLIADKSLGNRLSAIQSFDYVGARYSNAMDVFSLTLPLVEDMFELYWILSDALRALNVY